MKSVPSIHPLAQHAAYQRNQIHRPRKINQLGPAPANHRWVLPGHTVSLCHNRKEMLTRRCLLRTILITGLATRRGRPVSLERVAGLPHPRLFLPARRLRHLRREQERSSLRWIQFDALMQGKAPMPEPGFAHALYWVTTEQEPFGRLAIEWALGTGQDLRQLALVYDWCHRLLTAAERSALQSKLAQQLRVPTGEVDLPTARSLALAAIALAGEGQSSSDVVLEWVLDTWWKQSVVERLAAGDNPIQREHAYALMELLHAIRDNLLVDLRLDSRKYFAQWPLYLLLSYYPAVYPAPENDYRIPVLPDPSQEPDLRLAMLARAADLSWVAYDPNAQLSQFLQGWLIQDQFLMRHPFGCPYEFLWANPYLPGLSYYNAPQVFHDPDRGCLIARSSWDDNAEWFYFERGRMQAFSGGRIQQLDPVSFRQPLHLGAVSVVPAFHTRRFQVDCPAPSTYYLIGLQPDSPYDVEVDDEELREEWSDHGGLLRLDFPAGRRASVRWKPSPVATPRPHRNPPATGP